MAKWQFFFVCLFATIASASNPNSLTSLFSRRKNSNKVCVNIGSLLQAAGPFLPELGLVKYSHQEPDGLIIPPKKISGSPFDAAFFTQRVKKNIKLYVRVEKGFEYNVALGFAELQKRFCRKGARILDATVQSRTRTSIDIFDRVGCDKATFLHFPHVVPASNGLINISIKGRTGIAFLSVLCVTRIRPVIPTPSTSNMPTPTTSITRTPFPTASSTASPSPSNTPISSPSNTPAPTPSTTPSPSPIGLGPSTCQQEGCINLEGPGDYEVIGNSMSRDEDREDCTILPFSSAVLSIPLGARVKSALLYWSASGHMTNTDGVMFNGIRITASNIYLGGYHSYRFYGAVADVTELVDGSGAIIVSDIPYDASGILCSGNAAYAAWALAVVYERADLPRQRINLCFDNFQFTFPAGVYSSSVKCIDGGSSTISAKTTVVTFESDSYKGEFFSISGSFLGDNLFRGQTAPNLDILNFDPVALQKIREGQTSLVYTVQSYYVETRFGGAIEGLFMPLRVVAYTTANWR